MKKNFLKKMLILMLALCMMLFMAACNNAGDDQEAPDGDTLPVGGDDLDGAEDGDAEAEDPDGTDVQDPDGTDESDKQDETDEPDSSEITGPAPDQKPDPEKNPPQGDGSDYGVPIVSTLTEDDGNLLVLVNKEYTVARDYYPTDMVDIDGSLSTNQNLKVKREAYDAYLKMLKDAQAEGLNFCICSAYRSFEAQERLYYNSLASNGREYTDKMFAYPGRSEHHTGYAIDITSASMNWGLSQNYADYPDGAWITEHCTDYGFIIRYPKGKEDITGYMYEPWHIRYVGVDIAREITEAGITFEEYMGVA